MATTFTPPEGLLFGPRAVVPVVIRTRAICSPALPIAPRNERPPVGTDTGAATLNSILPLGSKNSILVTLASPTSVKTAPKPLTVAGTAPFVPGMEKVVSVTLLPSGVKIRGGLKKLKVVA
jgi:hypothetical protein